MPASLDNLRKVLKYAATGGAPEPLLREVAQDAVRSIASADPRITETLDLGRRIATMLLNAVEPEVIRDELKLSRDQYFRALRRWRDSRNSYLQDFPQL